MEQKETHLFILRIWREMLDGGQAEWRGRVQLVPGGELLYFRTWDALVEHIVDALPGGASRPGEAPTTIQVGDKGNPGS